MLRIAAQLPGGSAIPDDRLMQRRSLLVEAARRFVKKAKAKGVRAFVRRYTRYA